MHPNKEVLPESIIKKGSILKVLTTSFPQVIKLASPSLPTDHPVTSVRVLVGPEFLQFNQFQIAHFFSQTYQIANNSSRMGYRLEGTPIPLNNQPALISSGIVPGTVQINNAGMPIVLMRDAQTTGGYPRMATVLEEDIDRLAQMKPQEKIRFVFIK